MSNEIILLRYIFEVFSSGANENAPAGEHMPLSHRFQDEGLTYPWQAVEFKHLVESIDTFAFLSEEASVYYLPALLVAAILYPETAATSTIAVTWDTYESLIQSKLNLSQLDCLRLCCLHFAADFGDSETFASIAVEVSRAIATLD